MLAFLLVTCTAMSAADSALRISIQALPPRAGAPLLVEAIMNWRGPGILEGTLEFNLEKTAGFIHRTQAAVIEPD